MTARDFVKLARLSTHTSEVLDFNHNLKTIEILRVDIEYAKH